ncbi:ABC transporter substrate-binding protein [Oceanibacterium hippocampi]|uniref:Periplasmic dipeptide transport protein n=1 Tax=Oceanibacterium hippocampi TaxID=745714 RepID=A0A1Y5RL57_9PROT|nr:ABC transporter substrate-binding protein [Oceanibacterium hippocampi]SLN20052.1 Periplasmic dipeptide transport protein precursor [Oceanibacterium hippocampi]
MTQPPARTGNRVFTLAALFLAAAAALASPAQAYREPPSLAEKVAAGELPPIDNRLPAEPRIIDMTASGQVEGRYGGDLNTIIGRARDVRLMMVYGYARLVQYDENFRFVADLVREVDVEQGRIFTFHLRKGHKWSDGEPFTSEDFRYWWEDVANNEELSPAGPPAVLLVEGELPTVEFPDPETVRYSWSRPNPDFLPAIANAAPLLIYRPAHYLKQYHKNYMDLAGMSKMQQIRVRSWAAQHNQLDNLYKFDNPSLPTLQPWMNTTEPPATRFVGERNPYFHRVDKNGHQLPYIDRLIFHTSDTKLVPPKAAAGEADLQARYLYLSDITFLRENEERSGYRTLLWHTVSGAHLALFPNLTCEDPVWHSLFRDVRFRRALSLGIDRSEINEALFFGLAIEGNNTVQPASPLYEDRYTTTWATHDSKRANALLDEIGLTTRDGDGIRKLPDGRPLEIIVETAGESPEQSDVLELIGASWRKIGVKLFTKPSQRDALRNRVFSGEAMMTIWSGFENGVPNADTSPRELAPTSQQQYQWPKWGQYHETKGAAGEPPDLPEAVALDQLYRDWYAAGDEASRTAIWHEMLDIHVEQQFTIGIVSGVVQPVVVRNGLRNVPEEGIYNWDPGALFGIYGIDRFWFDKG